MSGHSKWSTIKRKKGAADARRGRVFTKLIKEITVAARDGGGDPEMNPRLRTAVENAKAQNMPADNIQKAIQRGTGELPGVTYTSVTYEAYGPGGVALFIECLTDNEKRTVAAVRHILTRHGGNLGKDGSVAWMFDPKGSILVDAREYDEETVLLTAIDAGAEDVVSEEGYHRVTTPFTAFQSVQDALHAAGIELEEAELAMIPRSTVAVEGAAAEKLLKLIEALEDEDDIQKVAANFDIDEEILAHVG
ncbi:MAG TPA: YebC/PmpR family DNA-binding transcriptional regulator [Gemmatimonadota bacterium]|nr:YebC/PmpR family DNA-binding transcriptional regulator [Gemmatimonadota bacterium]